MTRLDRILEVFERYDKLAENGVKSHNSALGQAILTEIRAEKEQLVKELIEHGCRRGIDIISQDIFLEKPEMRKETWSGGGL